MSKKRWLNRRGNVLVIRKSCITGKVVWVYRGPSRKAAHTAYCRECKKEVVRYRHWGESSAHRRADIIKILNDCLAHIPLTSNLTKQQKEAAQALKSLSKEDIACHSEFYEHIMEERRRRQEDAEIRKKMKEKELRQKTLLLENKEITQQ